MCRNGLSIRPVTTNLLITLIKPISILINYLYPSYLLSLFLFRLSFHFSISDNSYRSSHSPKEDLFNNSTSEISFTSNSESSVSGRYKNYDIQIAQIDIENFKSEDIEGIGHNNYTHHPMGDSTDTLR